MVWLGAYKFKLPTHALAINPNLSFHSKASSIQHPSRYRPVFMLQIANACFDLSHCSPAIFINSPLRRSSMSSFSRSDSISITRIISLCKTTRALSERPLIYSLANLSAWSNISSMLLTHFLCWERLATRRYLPPPTLFTEARCNLFPPTQILYDFDIAPGWFAIASILECIIPGLPHRMFNFFQNWCWRKANLTHALSPWDLKPVGLSFLTAKAANLCSKIVWLQKKNASREYYHIRRT